MARYSERKALRGSKGGLRECRQVTPALQAAHLPPESAANLKAKPAYLPGYDRTTWNRGDSSRAPLYVAARRPQRCVGLASHGPSLLESDRARPEGHMPACTDARS